VSVNRLVLEYVFVSLKSVEVFRKIKTRCITLYVYVIAPPIGAGVLS